MRSVILQAHTHIRPCREPTPGNSHGCDGDVLQTCRLATDSPPFHLIPPSMGTPSGIYAGTMALTPTGLSTSSRRYDFCEGLASSTRRRVATLRRSGSNTCPASPHPIRRPHAIIFRPFRSSPNSSTMHFISRNVFARGRPGFLFDLLEVRRRQLDRLELGLVVKDSRCRERTAHFVIGTFHHSVLVE